MVGERGCVPLARAEAGRAARTICEWPVHLTGSGHDFQQGPSLIRSDSSSSGAQEEASPRVPATCWPEMLGPRRGLEAELDS